MLELLQINPYCHNIIKTHALYNLQIQDFKNWVQEVKIVNILTLTTLYNMDEI
jgi:hypothetical protein